MNENTSNEEPKKQLCQIGVNDYKDELATLCVEKRRIMNELGDTRKIIIELEGEVKHLQNMIVQKNGIIEAFQNPSEDKQ